MTTTPTMEYWRNRIKQGPLTDFERAEMNRSVRVMKAARRRHTIHLALLALLIGFGLGMTAARAFA